MIQHPLATARTGWIARLAVILVVLCAGPPLTRATPPHRQDGSRAVVPAVPAVPADTLAAAWLPDPAGGTRALMEGRAWARLQAGGLGPWLQRRADESGLGLVRGVLSGLAGGSLDRALEALAGGGLLALLLPPPEEDGAPAFALVLHPRDMDAATGVLASLLALSKEVGPLPEGARWELALGEALLSRRGPRLLLVDGAPTLERFDDQGLAEGDGPPGLTQAWSGSGVLQAWFDGALLRADPEDGLPERLDDLGSSLLVGHLHQALLATRWGGLTLDLQAGRWAAELELALDAAPPEPFFPASRRLAVPDLDGSLGRLVLQRDLGSWWTRRDEWLSARGLADAIEPDGNLSLLFQRDLGPEVLGWLEPEVLTLLVEVPRVGPRPEPELPGLVLGFTPREGAPDDLPAAFVNAFLAVITFTNFDNGDPTRGLLEPDVERLADGSRLYRARWRSWRGEGPPPLRYNLAPALLRAADGRLWLASDDMLLRLLADAPSETVTADGWQLELDLDGLAGLLAANRELLEGRELLSSGGDAQAAAQAVERLLDGAGLFDAVLLEQRLDGDRMRVGLELHTR